MATKPTIIGLDPGRSQTTIAIKSGGGYRTVTIPSYLGNGRMAELLRLRGRGASIRTAGSTPGMSPNDSEIAIVFDGHEQFAGNLALAQGMKPSTARGDDTRYWNGFTKRLLFSAVGAAWEGTKIPPLRIATNLPIALWTADNDVRVRRSLVGEYRGTWSGKEIGFEVVGCFSVFEGAGPLARYGSEDPSVPQGVIDGGGGTLDLLFAYGQEPYMPRCGGRSLGVDRIGDILSDKVESEFGRRLDPKETRAILSAYAGKKPIPPIYVQTADGKRKEIRLNGQVEAADLAAAADVTSYIAELWGDGERGQIAANVSKLIFVGGMAYYPKTRAAIAELVGEVFVSDRPEDENAIGNAMIGSQFADADWADFA